MIEIRWRKKVSYAGTGETVRARRRCGPEAKTAADVM